MDGILIVDKPAGWTSHDVVAKLRGALRVKRVGHGGTLDPMATGVLPVFAGRATRAAQFCENADKEYIAGLRLGITTDTQDITGNMLRTCETSVTAEELRAVLPRFLGASEQIPPMYSAIKINGQKLYTLARRGIDVQRPARNIYISEIELSDSGIQGGGGREFLLRVACSKGTYIRTLCSDIGDALGCGAAMASLRRTKAGAFTESMAHSLDKLLGAIAAGQIEKLLIPVDSIFSQYSAVTLDESSARICKNGAGCRVPGVADGTYRFYGPNGDFLLLGEVITGDLKIIKSFFNIDNKGNGQEDD